MQLCYIGQHVPCDTFLYHQTLLNSIVHQAKKISDSFLALMALIKIVNRSRAKDDGSGNLKVEVC